MKCNNFVGKFFSEMNSNGIRYAVLRNYESLPESCGGSDLDIFVSSKDITKLGEILSKVSNSLDASLVSYTASNACPKLCYLNTKEGIQMDIFVGAITYKTSVIVSEETIEENTRTYNGIKVLDDSLGNIIAFIKEILNNGKCKDKYIIPITENKENYDRNNLAKNLAAFVDKFIDILYESIKSDKIKESILVLTALGRKGIKRKSSKNISTFLSKILRLFKQPGYTIAVLGTDGSGKSFIINSITPVLNEAFHNGIRYEHMRPNYLPSLAVAMGKKKADEPTGVCSNPHGSKPSGFIGSLIRLTYYWIDYTWGYFKKVYLDKAFKTHVWLFDRYYYDYYIDQRRARLNLPSWIIKLYGLFVPAPDLTICLGGDPEKIYARKPETSLEEVKRQTKVLKEFASTYKKAVWVDTTTTPEESIKAAMDAIVKMMSKRFANTKL